MVRIKIWYKIQIFAKITPEKFHKMKTLKKSFSNIQHRFLALVRARTLGRPWSGPISIMPLVLWFQGERRDSAFESFATFAFHFECSPHVAAGRLKRHMTRILERWQQAVQDGLLANDASASHRFQGA